jgi:hypothetical protein
LGVVDVGAALGPQPQPWLPSAFACASRAQQALTSFGAGPPQQPVDAAPELVLVSVFFDSLVLVMLMKTWSSGKGRSLSSVASSIG